MVNEIFHSTNSKNKEEKVNFEDALLKGLAPDYGLYMFYKNDIPRIFEEENKRNEVKKV